MKKKILIIFNYIILSICSLNILAEAVDSANSSDTFDDFVCTKA